jgi:predicted 3-demethylubiquinone-9 3-methyltransferase (glyoxalase superfamily)
MTKQKIVPNLWFDTEGEQAAKLYTSLFKNSRIGDTVRYSEAGQDVHRQQPGKPMTVDFELDGYHFTALNGGPYFKFNPSVSFFANLESKEEVNKVWDELSRDGSVLMPLQAYPFSELYGWVSDRYGLSWQLSMSGEGSSSPIVPNLMFVGDRAGQAEEAMNFYASVFSDAEVGEPFRYTDDQSPDQEGTVAFGPFKLFGQDFAAMDSAREHDFTFNEAISFIVRCQDQAEVDNYWNRLSAVPESEQCGWLKDRYGVSWQIIPSVLYTLLSSGDQGKADRVMEALLPMKKIDVAELEAAARG